MAVVDVRIVPTHELSPSELQAVRNLLDEAFEEDVTDDDWEHTIGGLHVIRVDGGIVSHASVVERLLMTADRPFRTGYVEGVATATKHQGRGHGSAVMREVGKIITGEYELGGLSTGLPNFYARLGWELWRGPTMTNAPSGPQRTPEEDGTVMILRTELTGDLDPTLPLMCDWRYGDVW